LEERRENMDPTPDTVKATAAKPSAKKKATRKPKPTAKKAKPATAKKSALKKSRKPTKVAGTYRQKLVIVKYPKSIYGKLAPIGNKAAFIRSLPKDTPAKEVIAKAKARGAKLTESYIYNIRGMDKLKARKKLAANSAYGKGTITRVPLKDAIASSVATTKPLTVEELFYAVVAEIGTRKAIHMLMAAHDTVASALRGVPAAVAT
jgi:hypothetical protein